MHTGQMLLVIGALTLLSIVTLSVNSLIVSKTTTILQAEAYLAAISIGQSMMDEILRTQYDTATIPPKKVYPGQQSKFTPYGRLGPETGPGINEVTSVSLPEVPDTSVGYSSAIKYNDVDDYHLYRRYYYSPSLGVFTVTDSIYYVLEDNPDQVSGSQTFFKKIVVTVRHRNLAPDDLSYNEWTSPYFVQISDIAVYRRYY